MGYTHAVFGVGLALLLVGKKNPTITFAFSYVGSVIPDFDLRYKHRKLLHNVFAMIVLTALVSAFNFNGALAFSIGYASHLALDSLTIKGVWLLWPIRDKSYGLRLCKSSSRLANAFFSTLGALFLIYALSAMGFGL